MEKNFIFTPENLIDNIEKLGPWSAYGLAAEALRYYYPGSYDEDSGCDINEEVRLLRDLGCESWDDLVVKFQNEVGYIAPNGFHCGAVNNY